MIITLFIQFLTGILTLLVGWLPKVNALPLGLDQYLTAGMGYMWYLFDIFPPFLIMWNGLLWILGWKVLLIVVRMIPLIGRSVGHTHT